MASAAAGVPHAAGAGGPPKLRLRDEARHHEGKLAAQAQRAETRQSGGVLTIGLFGLAALVAAGGMLTKQSELERELSPLYSVWGPPEHTHGGGRRSTASMPTHGGTDARGRCMESSAQWEGQARPLTPDSA